MDSAIYVVVPAFNERAVIRATVEPLLSRGYQVVVVDDASTDQTSGALDGLPVHVVRHSINLGQGAALATGMAYALGRGAGVIVHFDADGQHCPDDIAGIVEPILAGEADVVLGSRFLRPQDAQLVPAGRRWLLKLGIVFNGLLTGMWLSDAHNGLRALGRPAAAKMQLHANRYAHATEILDQIRRNRWRYVERPCSILYTDYSRAKGQRASNAFNIALDLLVGRLFR